MSGEELSPLTLVEVVGRFPNSSNMTVLALADDESRWVYKPERGEQPLWDFPWRSLAAREVLAFETSNAMGLDIVPETVLADGPFGPGSAQRYLDEDEAFDHRPLFARHRLDQRLWPFAVFDLVTNNADRKIGHIIKQAGSDHLWGIDNGLTFHRLPKLRTVLWGFAGRPIPASLLASVGGIDASLLERIATLLSEDEAEATSIRIEMILAHPVHPDPPSDRPPVPWPVW